MANKSSKEPVFTLPPTLEVSQLLRAVSASLRSTKTPDGNPSVKAANFATMLDELCKNTRHRMFLIERMNRQEGKPSRNIILEDALLTSFGRWAAWAESGIYTEFYYIRSLEKFNHFVEILNVHLLAMTNLMRILSNEFWQSYFQKTRTGSPTVNYPYLAFHDLFYLRRNTLGNVETYVNIDRIDSVADMDDRNLSVTFRCKGYRPLSDRLRLADYLMKDTDPIEKEMANRVNLHFDQLLNIFCHGKTEGL